MSPVLSAKLTEKILKLMTRISHVLRISVMMKMSAIQIQRTQLIAPSDQKSQIKKTTMMRKMTTMMMMTMMMMMMTEELDATARTRNPMLSKVTLRKKLPRSQLLLTANHLQSTKTTQTRNTSQLSNPPTLTRRIMSMFLTTSPSDHTQRSLPLKSNELTKT
jgi:hypothetical protein